MERTKRSLIILFGLVAILLLVEMLSADCPSVPYYVEGYAGAHRKGFPYPADFGCGLFVSKIKIPAINYKAYPITSSECYYIPLNVWRELKEYANQRIDVTSRTLVYLLGLQNLKQRENEISCQDIKRDDYIILETLIRPGSPKRGILITGWIIKSEELQTMFLREHDFDKIYEAASAKFAIQTAALKAITAFHSEFSPYSRDMMTGRCGLMGLKINEVRLGVERGLREIDLLHPEKNIFCGARLFRFLLHRLDNPSYYDCAEKMGVPKEDFRRLYMYFSQKAGEPMSYYPDEVAGVKRNV